jgi:hypothetical protein
VDYPDPAIFSQAEELAAGRIPTWDNPDISALTVGSGGFALSHFEFTVRNLAHVAATGVLVDIKVGDYGIGTWRRWGRHAITLGPLELRKLPLPPYDAPPQQTPEVFSATNLSMRVELLHPHDGNPLNNVGEFALAGAYTRRSGRHPHRQFEVWNWSADPLEVHFEVIGPPDISVAVQPPTLVVPARSAAPAPFLSARIELQVSPALHGVQAAPARRDATLIARDGDGTLIGGLTYVVMVDD